MSCRIEPIGDCGDVAGLGRALFIPNKEDNNWLNQCVISLSSCGSLLAVAYKNRLCLLSSQWISSTESTSYLISWSGTLQTDVTTLLTLPICSTSHSSQNTPDWLCIIVGFKNGSVGFYTHTGHQLHIEKLDDKPIQRLSCHTGCFGTEPDDVHVLVASAEFIITGSSLFQTLRYAKAQMARVQAGVASDYYLDGRTIGVRRWTFAEQDVINDAVVVGLELKNTYDHLLAASTYAGYDSWYRAVPPHNTLVVAGGARPYLGFHYALEGGAAPPLHDVARAIASKLKSALPGWLGGGSGGANDASNNESKIRSEPLSMRSGVSDLQRHATTLALSPDRRLAAIADNLGRIALLDVQKGHIIRIFKGHRDSQCAFVQVFEQDTKRGPQLVNIKNTKRAIFLIIYNPKKGIIDIRLMQRGSRVAVFTATKNARLLYNTNGLVGAEPNYSHRKLNLPIFQCVLMDADGKLKKFFIPFFYALEGENSDRSKDVHLVRELRDFIKQNASDEEGFENEIIRRLQEIKTLDLKKHCLEMLIGNSDVSPKVGIESAKAFLEDFEELDKLTAQEETFKNYCSSFIALASFFLLINTGESSALIEVVSNEDEDVVPKEEKEVERIEDEDADCKEDNDVVTKEDEDVIPKEDIDVHPKEEENKTNLSKLFHLTDTDNEVLKRLLELAQESVYKEIQHAGVSFADDKKTMFKDFIAAFNLDEPNSIIKLKPSLTLSQLETLAADTFKLIFKDIKMPASILSYHVRSSGIDPKDLVKLLIIYWMETPLAKMNLNYIARFVEILYYTCESSKEATKIVYNELSPWWQDVRDMLVDMPCPLRSMIVAMVCRVVGQVIEHQAEEAVEADSWVSLTKENAKWGILIGKLEDISLLSIVLLFKDSFIGEALPKLKPNALDINLKFIYNRGKGSVSELIAKWLCCMGVTPGAILANAAPIEETESCDNDKKVKNKKELTVEYDAKRLHLDKYRVCIEHNPKIFKWFNLLKKQFPCSTHPDNLIANMCWEYAAAWQKETKRHELLEAVISCLQNITDAHLLVGLSTLIWTTYLKEMFELSCRLVNKVGKLPKERICLQEVAMSDANMVKYLEITTRYLENFYTYVENAAGKEKVKFIFEKIWDKSIPALVEVAQDSTNINNDILRINQQISCAIYCQCYFNLKVTKPLNSLFDCDLQNVFSGISLVEDGIILSKGSEERLRGPRIKFLCKVLGAAVELITCEDTDVGEVRYNTAEESAWTDRVYALADLWGIDDDFLNREQVSVLVSSGREALGSAALNSVRDPAPLLPILLLDLEQRLKAALETAPDPADLLAALPPDLVSNLNTLESSSQSSGASPTRMRAAAQVLEQAAARAQHTPAKLTRRIDLALYAVRIISEMN